MLKRLLKGKYSVACFTSTKVQVLTPEQRPGIRAKASIVLVYSVYLLYTYKSTNTDA